MEGGPVSERLYYFVPNLQGSDAGFDDVVRDPCGREQANLVGSLCSDGLHRPVLDIDLPCRLVPSSTEGHFHLYIERALSTEAYMELVDALGKAGIISQFYAKAARIRGQTFCRPEWVKKAPDVSEAFK